MLPRLESIGRAGEELQNFWTLVLVGFSFWRVFGLLFDLADSYSSILGTGLLGFMFGVCTCDQREAGALVRVVDKTMFV